MHNKPATQSNVATKIPGREFFYLSKDAKEFTVLLIAIGRLLGTKQLKPTTEGDTSTPFVFKKMSKDLMPRAISRTAQREYAKENTSYGMASARGRTPGRGGKVDFTLADLHQHIKKSSRAFNSKYLRVSLNEKDETTIDQFFSNGTNRLLNDTRILAFFRAADAVSAARAVGKKNRGKGNVRLRKAVKG